MNEQGRSAARCYDEMLDSAAMQFLDLRQIGSRQLAPLLAEEAKHWCDELHWDYRASVELIKRFVDAHSLAGAVAMENGRPAGYGFFVFEEHKGLIGGLFVSQTYPQLPLSRRLLEEMVSGLRALPRLGRIEAQLMPFGCSLDQALVELDFRLFSRQFMFLELRQAAMHQLPLSRGFVLERWQDEFFDPCARLIHLAYANHVDSEINDQYRTEAGAMKFLKNIIVLPGCGQFIPECSFVLRQPGNDHLIGVVLNSTVSAGVAHTTQICVMPGYQGHGLGRQLMEAAIRALGARGFRALSLTVTASNATAVRLYDQLAFRILKSFAAGVWQE